MEKVFGGAAVLYDAAEDGENSRSTPANRIAGFFGPYRFLSNFWFAPTVYDGVTYPSSEHAYQAAKTLDPNIRHRIATTPKPQEAKKIGQTAPMRADWDDVKIGVMRTLVYDKFTRNPALGRKLLETGDAELVEENTWGDRFWGRDPDGNGQNQLGRILMEVREQLR